MQNNLFPDMLFLVRLLLFMMIVYQLSIPLPYICTQTNNACLTN